MPKVPLDTVITLQLQLISKSTCTAVRPNPLYTMQEEEIFCCC